MIDLVTDPESDRPLHRQLDDILRARIASSQYAPGIRLPSEEHLAQEAGLNRDTVRRAMALLRAEGLVVVRRHSKGTFVREAPAGQTIDLDSGAVVRARMPTPAERRRLGVAEGVPVIAVNHDGGTTLYAADRVRFHVGGGDDGLLRQAAMTPEEVYEQFFAALRQLPSPSLDAALRAAVDAGWRQTDLAKALDVSPQRVHQRVSNACLKSLVCRVPVPGPPDGARPPRRHKRSPEEAAQLVADVVAGYKAGATIHQLAKRFGLGSDRVHGILVDAGVPRRPPGAPKGKRRRGSFRPEGALRAAPVPTTPVEVGGEQS